MFNINLEEAELEFKGVKDDTLDYTKDVNIFESLEGVQTTLTVMLYKGASDSIMEGSLLLESKLLNTIMNEEEEEGKEKKKGWFKKTLEAIVKAIKWLLSKIGLGKKKVKQSEKAAGEQLKKDKKANPTAKKEDKKPEETKTPEPETTKPEKKSTEPKNSQQSTNDTDWFNNAMEALNKDWVNVASMNSAISDGVEKVMNKRLAEVQKLNPDDTEKLGKLNSNRSELEGLFSKMQSKIISFNNKIKASTYMQAIMGAGPDGKDHRPQGKDIDEIKSLMQQINTLLGKE